MSTSRQQRRAQMKKVDKATAAMMKERQKPVTREEFAENYSQMIAQIAIIDTFLEAEYGEKWHQYIKDYIAKMKDKSEEAPAEAVEEVAEAAVPEASEESDG